MRLREKQRNLVQWDKGQILIVDECPSGTLVHFFNIKSKTGYVLQTNENLEVEIPDILLQQPYPITAWIYRREDDSYIAENRREFQVIRRPRPEDYIYTDDEKMYWDSKLDKQWSPDDSGKILIIGRDGRITASGAVGSDKFFKFIQASPSDSWLIDHNLEKRPSVIVVDSAGTQVIGEITYINNNILRIDFQASFSGEAYLN